MAENKCKCGKKVTHEVLDSGKGNMHLCCSCFIAEEDKIKRTEPVIKLLGWSYFRY